MSPAQPAPAPQSARRGILREPGWHRAAAAIVLLTVIASGMPERMAHAADPDCIRIETRAEVRRAVATEQGGESIRLVPAEKIGAGEEVLYTVSVTNICANPAADLAIDVPVPAHTRYVVGSAIAPAAQVLFSVDGGFRYAPPQALQVAMGEGETRAAQPGDYTHIRWMMSKALPPQAVVFARFRAVVK